MGVHVVITILTLCACIIGAVIFGILVFKDILLTFVFLQRVRLNKLYAGIWCLFGRGRVKWLTDSLAETAARKATLWINYNW